LIEKLAPIKEFEFFRVDLEKCTSITDEGISNFAKNLLQFEYLKDLS